MLKLSKVTEDGNRNRSFQSGELTNSISANSMDENRVEY